MMNVALLNGNWYPQTGGGIVHVSELATRLVTQFDCRVVIITKSTNSPSESVDGRLPDAVDVVRIPGTDSRWRILNEFQYTVGVLRQVFERDYDVVHAHTNTATFPLQILPLIDDARTVVTVHGASLDLSVTYTGSGLDSVYTVVRRLLLTRFNYDAVISVSSELSEVLSEFHDDVRFIPNGVDTDDFPDPSGYDNKDILFVGRLRPKKNVTDAVESMRYVRENHPDATLHIVGEGPLEEAVKQAAESHGVDANVRVYGYVEAEALQQLYKKCPVFVIPSDWEGHPLVLLEAWASGQIVVGTNVEGIREFVTEGYGELVDLHDPESLGEILSRLLSDPDRIEASGTSAKSFVEREYSWDWTVKRTYDLYSELINRPSTT